jgi:site-specific recombinase XerD
VTTAQSALARRRLSREHFAFLRGVLSGLSPRELWSRYLMGEGRFDERHAASTLRWLKDELAAIARRDHRPRAARLIAMDLSRVPPDPATPSFEDFAQRFEPGFYTERELLELFADEFPPNRKTARRARLVAEQLEALAWLESVAASDPGLEDRPSAWIEPRVAERLERAGLATLRQLIDRINGKGLRWWTGIARVGPTSAARVLAWLAPHAARLSQPIGEHVARPIRERAPASVTVLTRRTAVVPLEQFRVPSELDGSEGVFRAPRKHCLMSAATDYEAILAWLRSKRSPHTVRAYRKEAERFLLWAILVRRKPLSSMTVEDCEDYRDFIVDPQPREVWCGQRGRERWGPLWRPFNGPLDPTSERHAVTILRTLYQWLMSQGYLVGNPWQGISTRLARAPAIQAGRAFTRKQWALISEKVKALPDIGANRRLGVVLTLLYATGMRREELVTRKVGDLAWQTFDDESGGWMLTVLGKGGKLREVPIPNSIFTIVRQYLIDRGLQPEPDHPDNREAALIGRIDDANERMDAMPEGFDPRTGVTAGTIYDQLRQFFMQCADELASRAPRDADRLRMASTHWLRHTHGTHAVAAGIPADVVQNNLGHASIATTGIYVHTEKKRRHAEMQRLLHRS